MTSFSQRQQPLGIAWPMTHALDRDKAVKAWWRSPLGDCRTAALGMGSLPESISGPEGTWLDFHRPFGAAADHASLIADPLQGTPMASVGTDTPSPALSAQTGVPREPRGIGGPEDGGSRSGLFREKAVDVNAAALSAASANGRTRGSGPVNGTWVGSGNPTLRSDSENGRGSENRGPLPLPASPKADLASLALARETAIPPKSGKPGLSAPPSPFETWNERVARKLRGFGPADSDPGNRRKASPVVPTGTSGVDPEAMRHFKAWINRAGPSATAVKGPGFRGPAGFPDSQSDLPAAAPGNASPDPLVTGGGRIRPGSMDSYPSWNGNPPSVGLTSPGEGTFPDTSTENKALYGAQGANPPGWNQGVQASLPPAGLPDTGASRLLRSLGLPDPLANPSGPAVPAPGKNGSPAVEWLDEEDDLAGKLHRLLRRQAKRRGVDLS
jgi:hypothetical protein